MKKLILLIIALIVIVGFLIVQQNNLDLAKNNDRKELATGMFSWFGKVADSTVDTVKYAADQEWLPDSDNETKVYIIEE